MQTILDVKCKAFAVRIVHFYKFLTSTQKEAVLSKQILRSGTSIGANARERLNAQSNADFINKLFIDEIMFSSLNDDLKEIIALITSSIKTIKQKEQ